MSVPPATNRVKGRVCIKVNAISLAILIRLLKEGTRTCQELAEETGLHILTIYQWCRELHKQKVIHIVGWEVDSRGRYFTKVYMLGEGKDAKRDAQSGAARQRACRERKRKVELQKLLTRTTKCPEVDIEETQVENLKTLT